MLSQVFILSARGDTIIFRDYRGDITKSSPEIFFRKLRFTDEGAAPVFDEKGIQFVYVRRGGLYIVGTTRANDSPSMYLEFLSQFAGVIKDYCGVLSEDSVRQNFTLVYELTDELADYGHIQDTSSQQLKAFVFNDPVLVAEGQKSSFMDRLRLTEKKTVSSSASNRSIIASDEKKKKNEIFVDVIEKLDVIFARDGSIIKSSVAGVVTMKNFLSGQPFIRMSLSENLRVGRDNSTSRFNGITIDDCNFHKCVNLSGWDVDRTLQFSPPDGETNLMNYRIDSVYEVPFRIHTFVEESSKQRIEVTVKINADNIPSESFASNVIIRLPLPSSVVSCGHDFLGYSEAKEQTFEFLERDNVAVWGIRKFLGRNEEGIRFKMNLDSDISPFERKSIGPVSLSFEVPMHNVSGIELTSLQIEERGTYNPSRWIRYITLADSYVARL